MAYLETHNVRCRGDAATSTRDECATKKPADALGFAAEGDVVVQI